ncbi:PAS domain S-box protein [Sabulilitoribacter multivorans]|uniref:histidine kinase n=1 Tax=Flaviramulus multivorans TaxID=1304750 RepID=A0ABS9IHM5_9FLAO|nr:PAS domain S-box protein [Flaviramulus multivorans]MCF7559925.1 PAS domain S-box protein [Flaviramulus multivorans]
MEAIKYNLLNSLNEDLIDIITDNSIISVTDALGRIEYANHNFCEIMECDAIRLIGETHELLKSHLHSDKIYKNLWQTIRMGKKWQGILNDTSYTGKPFWLDTTIIPVKNNVENTIKYVALYKNVTKSYLQNNQLKESNIAHSKYRSIYQSINAGIIVVTDDKGNVTEWNKGAESAFGYSKVEILGHPLTVLMSKKFRKKNIKELLKGINKIKRNQKADTIEMYCLRKDGKEFPVEFALSSLSVDNNDFYCAIMLDITKRKGLEDKLKQKTKDLELFLYRSAHDLKAPFSSAEGLINLLKDEEVNERVTSLTKMLDTTIKSGKVLVENITQASVISTKKYVPIKIEFDKIIENVLKVLSGTKDFQLYKISIDIESYHCYNSNPEWLNSIFQNLIQNAIKYSKKPTKTFTPRIDISVKALQDEVVISICDNGQGINKVCIKKIFDLYYRANIEDTPGNGLGLYVVKNIVEDLNGKISVTSEIDKGTCFEIVLPNLL